MLKKSLLIALITFVTIVSTAAQSLQYSSDGKTLAVNLIVNFENYKTVNQFLFFDALSGKIKSSVNVQNSDVDEPLIMFANGNQNLVIGDRINLGLIKLTADNKAEFQNSDAEFRNPANEFIGLAQSTDGKILFKLYSDELIAYNFLTKKVLPENGKKIAATEDKSSKAEFLTIQQNGQMMVEYQKKDAEHFLVIYNLTAKTSKKIALPYKYEDSEEVKFWAKISQNGGRLALRCEKQTESQITVWDLKTATSLGTFSIASPETAEKTDFYSIKDFAISPDGQKIAVNINDNYNEDLNKLLVLWDIATKKEIIAEAKKYSEEDFAHDLVFSPDSKTLAVSAEVLLVNSFSVKIQILDANTGKFIREF